MHDSGCRIMHQTHRCYLFMQKVMFVHTSRTSKTTICHLSMKNNTVQDLVPLDCLPVMESRSGNVADSVIMQNILSIEATDAILCTKRYHDIFVHSIIMYIKLLEVHMISSCSFYLRSLVGSLCCEYCRYAEKIVLIILLADTRTKEQVLSVTDRWNRA